MKEVTGGPDDLNLMLFEFDFKSASQVTIAVGRIDPREKVTIGGSSDVKCVVFIGNWNNDDEVAVGVEVTLFVANVEFGFVKEE